MKLHHLSAPGAIFTTCFLSKRFLPQSQIIFRCNLSWLRSFKRGATSHRSLRFFNTPVALCFLFSLSLQGVHTQVCVHIRAHTRAHSNCTLQVRDETCAHRVGAMGLACQRGDGMRSCSVSFPASSLLRVGSPPSCQLLSVCLNSGGDLQTSSVPTSSNPELDESLHSWCCLRVTREVRNNSEREFILVRASHLERKGRIAFLQGPRCAKQHLGRTAPAAVDQRRSPERWQRCQDGDF